MPCKRNFIVIAWLVVSITSLSNLAAAEAASVHTITATANVNGSITPEGAVTVVAGGSQTLAITPSPGYLILSVIVDGSNRGTVSSYTFTNVRADHTIAAYFKPVTYTLTATAEANGAISSPGVNTVGPGSSMTFMITPIAGYHVATVLVDGLSQGPLSFYTFRNVKASHTITAAFAENSWFIIDAGAGANGGISPLGRGSVLGGTNQKYTIIPAAGYRAADVVVDGVSKGTLASYTFHSIRESHTVSVTFIPDVYTIDVTAANGGSVTVTGSSISTAAVNGGESSTITVNPGANLSFTVTPDPGKAVTSLVDNDAYRYGITTYSLTNIKKDHTISVYFK